MILNHSSTLEDLLKRHDALTLSSRKKRLGYLCSILHFDSCLSKTEEHEIAVSYFEEAQKCWVSGCFASAISMAKLACEELLRSIYRQHKKTATSSNPEVSIGILHFALFVDDALQDGYLLKEEAESLRIINSVFEHYLNVKVDERDVAGNREYIPHSVDVRNGLHAAIEYDAANVIWTLVHVFSAIYNRHRGDPSLAGWEILKGDL